MSTDERENATYKRAGVDVAKADRLVSWLQGAAEVGKSSLGEVVGGIGGFAGLYRPSWEGIDDPLLVACTDGVGTKALIAAEHGLLGGIGADLVGMCVNDLYALGARPMFFLDYYASGRLRSEDFRAILTGVREALADCQTSLLGGETAEMPGMYPEGRFDLAGFVVGVVDSSKVLGRHRVRAGDILVGLPASGFHSNGFSLIRKWWNAKAPEPWEIEYAMRPTILYREVPEVLASADGDDVHAIAHVTGGGLEANLERVLPDDVVGRICWEKMPVLGPMQDILRRHGVEHMLVRDVFNLGIGMVLAVDASAESRTIDAFRCRGLEACVIGVVESKTVS